MGVTGIIISIVLAAAFGFAGYGKLTDNPQLVAVLSGLGVPAQLRRIIGVLEVAAAVGLLVGLFVNSIGVAAAIGIVTLMIGALFYHLRAGDIGPQIAAPAVLGVLAAVLIAVA